VAAALMHASCTLESRPLARVGPNTITVSEFLEAARAMSAIPQNPDSAKLVLLDELIRRELLKLEARERPLLPTEERLRIAKQAADNAMLREMTTRFAPADLPVSQAEIERFYDWSKSEYYIRVIHSPGDGILRHARERIEAGEDFSTLAQRMNTSGVVPPDGDLGYVPGGSMPEPLDGLIRGSAPPALIGPVRVGLDAWFLVQVSGRRDRRVPPIAEVATQIEQQLRVRKQRMLLQRAVDQMQRAHEYRMEPDAAQAVYSRVQGTRPDTTGFPDDMVMLARYRTDDGWKRYMLSDATEDLARSERPDLSNTAAIARWIETTVLSQIVLVEARSRRLDQEPAIQRIAEEQADAVALQELFREEVMSRIQPPTEAEMRAEYALRAGPGAPPFESVPPELLERLYDFIVEDRRNLRMKEYTDELRSKHPVMIDAERLERLTWPLPNPPSLQPERG